MSPEEYHQFKQGILSKVRHPIFGGGDDLSQTLLSLLLPPARIPIDLYVLLTDWQLVFLYLLPLVEREMRELEAIDEAESKHG